MTPPPPADGPTENNSPAGWVDPKVDRELRIAVTMNGGVSLAVYIGGVAHELDRCTRKDGGYFELLKKFGYVKTVIDVITGTSAGGINAAALALAQANAEGDLAQLKELWIQNGQIGDLLREPFHRGPASLLKGDDYFYPQIRSAFRRLTQNFHRAVDASDQVRPVDLTIPATLLTPVQSELSDYLGTAVVQPQHAGLFHFRGGTGDPEPDTSNPVDVFAKECIAEGKRETVEALALAARASAGFPAAFEPTFIPVHHKGDTADGRPDMASYADWATSAEAGDDLSRFAVDGGVLANTPTRPALEGIRRREVTNMMVRRVLILVHPHAEYARDIKNKLDNVLHPPTLVGALGGVAGAAGSVGSRKYVEEIKQHNEMALQWRDGRRAAMAEFDAEDLTKLLGKPGDSKQPAWRLFRKLRLRRGAYISASNVRTQFDTPFAKLIEYAIEILEEDDRKGTLAFLPKEPPVRHDDPPHDEWRWGLNLAVGIASQTTELLRQLISEQAYIPDDHRKAIAELAEAAWIDASNVVVDLERLADQERKSEADKPPDAGAGTAANSPDGKAADGSEEFERQRIRQRLRENLDDYNKQMLWLSGAKPGDRGPAAMRTVRKIVQALLEVIKRLDDNGIDGDTGCGERANTASLLLRTNPLRNVGGDYKELMKRMLQVEIVAYLTAEHNGTDDAVPTVPIDFVQLSAHIEQHFAQGFTADDKLAGMSLHRFGAFLKRSWRANDWIWGRLDAVKILMLVLLTPEIIRGYCMTYYPKGCAREVAPDVVVDIAGAAFRNDLSLYQTLVDDRLKNLHSSAVTEVEQAIAGNDAPMKNLASLTAYGLQLAVAREDVPWLAGTIRDDRDDGAIGAQTGQFLNRLEQKDPPDAYGLLTDFAQSRIGQEAVADQMPSDLLIRTTATAAATAVTALSAEESGLGFARPATKVARGLIALPYWVLLALTGRGRIARVLAAVLLALGVSLTALSLVTPLHGLIGKLVPTFGVASLLTVFVYAALRTQSIVHGAALLGLFIPLIAYAVDGGEAATKPGIMGETWGSLIWVVVLLLVWVMVVANLTSHTRPPAATLTRATEAAWMFYRLNWRAFTAGAGVAVAATATVYLAWPLRPLQHGVWDGRVCTWSTAFLISATAAGFLFARCKSVRFRQFRPVGSPPQIQSVDPALLATAWSPFYGLIYLVVGVWLGMAGRHWATIASVVSLGLSLLLSLVAVNLIPYIWEGRLASKIVTCFEPAQVPDKPKPAKPEPAQSESADSAEREATAKAFTVLGSFSNLLSCTCEPDLLSESQPPQLTRNGQRVWRRACRMSARRARVRQSVGP